GGHAVLIGIMAKWFMGPRQPRRLRRAAGCGGRSAVTRGVRSWRGYSSRSGWQDGGLPPPCANRAEGASAKRMNRCGCRRIVQTDDAPAAALAWPLSGRQRAALYGPRGDLRPGGEAELGQD